MFYVEIFSTNKERWNDYTNDAIKTMVWMNCTTLKFIHHLSFALYVEAQQPTQEAKIKYIKNVKMAIKNSDSIR